MGNTGSSGGSHSRRRNRNHTHPPPPTQSPQTDINGNQYVFAASTPYPPHPPQFPNNQPGYYQYTGYYPPPPPNMHLPMPAPYDHRHRGAGPRGELAHNNWAGMRYPCGAMPPPTPYVEHQKAVTIRNDVNLKKETLRVEMDEENPGSYLVAFTFDATVAGSITIFFFAKEEEDCDLASTKESLQSTTVSFQQGLGQIFRQHSGTGINFSKFEESELLKEGDMQIYPLVVKAAAAPLGNESETENPKPTNSQITQALFEIKEVGEYQVRVVKQILWVSGMRYELQEIYGIGNSVDNDFDGNDPGKECVICLSEPRDTTVLPCRHMCMCSGCAKVLRFQTNRCPICRQPVERLLEIKVSKPDDQETVPC